MSALSISALTDHIKGLLEGDPLLEDVWVEGEVSNCRPYSSGHWYFSLKDDAATLSCVMWKFQAARQQHLPEDGGKFRMHGRVSVYAGRGQYQLVVDQVEPAGLGDLHARFEALKQQLAEEGLFAAERKRPLPAFPRRIGIATSPQAAALRDVLNVLGRRWPVAEVLLAPTRVQGEAAPPEIVASLAALGRARVDLILLVRGGGSLEDLWAFNDESVARAVAACPVPVVAGVGHETDFSIADFAADLRAPTPSAAAELATPDVEELRQAVDAGRMRMDRRMGARLDEAAERAAALRRRLDLAGPRRQVSEAQEHLGGLRERLERAMAVDRRLRRAALEARRERLAALDPRAVLARGYAHVTRSGDGFTVRQRADAPAGTSLQVRVTDGSFEALVAGQASLFDPDTTEDAT